MADTNKISNEHLSALCTLIKEHDNGKSFEDTRAAYERNGIELPESIVKAAKLAFEYKDEADRIIARGYDREDSLPDEDTSALLRAAIADLLGSKGHNVYDAIRDSFELRSAEDKVLHRLANSWVREGAFMLEFEKLFSDSTAEEIIEDARACDVFTFDSRAEKLFLGVEKHAEALDEVIGRFSPSRSVNRIGRVSLAILRIAVYESMYTDTAVNIAVSEAVRLSQTYDMKNDTKFVNGLLGNFSRSDVIPENKREDVRKVRK